MNDILKTSTFLFEIKTKDRIEQLWHTLEGEYFIYCRGTYYIDPETKGFLNAERRRIGKSRYSLDNYPTSYQEFFYEPLSLESIIEWFNDGKISLAEQKNILKINTDIPVRQLIDGQLYSTYEKHDEKVKPDFVTEIHTREREFPIRITKLFKTNKENFFIAHYHLDESCNHIVAIRKETAYNFCVDEKVDIDQIIKFFNVPRA